MLFRWMALRRQLNHGSGDNYLDTHRYDELLEHTVKEYTDIWLEYAREDEDDFDINHESDKARKTFMKYFESE